MAETTTTTIEQQRHGPASGEGTGARARILEGVPVEERRMELAGIPTAILEAGEGPPIVFLHGPGEHAARWAPVIESLAGDHRVVAPDLPGHGESGSGEDALDDERVMAWLDALVDACGEQAPTLVGHLVGGAIAARYAILHGSRIERLVLVDSLGLAPFQPDPSFGAALQAFITSPGAETHDALWQRCAFDLDGLRGRMGDRWQALKEYNLDRAGRPELQAAMGSLMERFGLPAIPEGELARITVPTALIWGREDLATDLGVAKTTSERLGWPLYVIDEAADDPPLERPRAFVDALRRATRGTDLARAWGAIATGYDTFVTPSHDRLAEQGLELADLRAGMRFLDVAAGTGALSLAAARSGAAVTATDISPSMIDECLTRAEEQGLDLDARVMDGHDLDFDDDTFDVAGSQFGVMLFEDAARAIREMTRVVKPDGRVFLTVFDDPSRVEFLHFFARGVRAVRPDFEGLPTDPPPLPFQFRDPQVLRSTMEEAGLRDIRVSSLTERMELRDGSHLWAWLLNSNPIPGMILAQLGVTDDERRVIEDRLSDLVRERADGGEIAVLTSAVHVGVGTK